MTLDAEDAPPEHLDQEFRLEEPPAKVWRALIEPELVARWLLPQVSDAASEAPEGARPIRCEPLDAEPGSRVSYRWRDGALDSIVTFSIAGDADGGTHLRVLHTALPKAGPPRAAANANHPALARAA